MADRWWQALAGPGAALTGDDRRIWHRRARAVLLTGWTWQRFDAPHAIVFFDENDVYAVGVTVCGVARIDYRMLTGQSASLRSWASTRTDEDLRTLLRQSLAAERLPLPFNGVQRLAARRLTRARVPSATREEFTALTTNIDVAVEHLLRPGQPLALHDRLGPNPRTGQPLVQPLRQYPDRPGSTLQRHAATAAAAYVQAYLIEAATAKLREYNRVMDTVIDEDGNSLDEQELRDALTSLTIPIVPVIPSETNDDDIGTFDEEMDTSSSSSDADSVENSDDGDDEHENSRWHLRGPRLRTAGSEYAECLIEARYGDSRLPYRNFASYIDDDGLESEMPRVSDFTIGDFEAPDIFALTMRNDPIIVGQLNDAATREINSLDPDWTHIDGSDIPTNDLLLEAISYYRILMRGRQAPFNADVFTLVWMNHGSIDVAAGLVRAVFDRQRPPLPDADADAASNAGRVAGGNLTPRLPQNRA